jgi:hypothetical protein
MNIKAFEPMGSTHANKANGVVIWGTGWDENFIHPPPMGKQSM